jgi:hypothetical protein
VYPKVSRMVTWSENCKWYSSLPLDEIVSQSSEFCHHNPLWCFSISVCCWIHPHVYVCVCENALISTILIRTHFHIWECPSGELSYLMTLNVLLSYSHKMIIHSILGLQMTDMLFYMYFWQPCHDSGFSPWQSQFNDRMDSTCWICGEQSGAGVSLLREFHLLPANHHSTNPLYSSITTWGTCDRCDQPAC